MAELRLDGATENLLEKSFFLYCVIIYVNF